MFHKVSMKLGRYKIFVFLSANVRIVIQLSRRRGPMASTVSYESSSMSK